LIREWRPEGRTNFQRGDGDYLRKVNESPEIKGDTRRQGAMSRRKPKPQIVVRVGSVFEGRHTKAVKDRDNPEKTLKRGQNLSRPG